MSAHERRPGWVYAIKVETFEGGKDFPAVIHTFVGNTRAEAEGYLSAHLNSDAFFRQCQERGFYSRSRGAAPVECGNVTASQGWTRPSLRWVHRAEAMGRRPVPGRLARRPIVLPAWLARR